MDWLTFIAKVVKALAWPGAFLAVFLVLRKEIPGIVRSLRKLKFKDFELDFGEAAKAVASDVKDAVPSSQQDVQLVGESRSAQLSRLAQIAEMSPRAAILEAWLLVEASAVDVIRKRTSNALTSLPGPMRLRDNLVRAELLSAKQLAIFEDLRTLRNQAVHAPEAQFTKEAVSSYIEAALSTAAYLERLAS